MTAAASISRATHDSFEQEHILPLADQRLVDLDRRIQALAQESAHIKAKATAVDDKKAKVVDFVADVTSTTGQKFKQKVTSSGFALWDIWVLGKDVATIEKKEKETKV
jgi:hypothetical protein